VYVRKLHERSRVVPGRASSGTALAAWSRKRLRCSALPAPRSACMAAGRRHQGGRYLFYRLGGRYFIYRPPQRQARPDTEETSRPAADIAARTAAAAVNRDPAAGAMNSRESIFLSPLLRGVPAIGKLGSCHHGNQVGVRHSVANTSRMRPRVLEFMLGQDARRRGADGNCYRMQLLCCRGARRAWRGTSKSRHAHVQCVPAVVCGA